MKNIYYFFILLCIPTLINAQELSFGIKGGINSSKFSTNNIKQTTENTTGYHGGFFAQFKGLGFMFQPEVLVNQRRGEFTLNKDSINTIKINQLDIPLLVGYSIFGKARIYAGPSYSVLISAAREANFADANFKETVFNKSNFTGVVGAGIDIWKLTFDIRYDFGITAIGNELLTNQGKIDYGKRINSIQFSLGYKLIKL